ncbi:prolyl oligopeptidase family serine peptidase [Bradyrhizobium sp. 83012]|uniref:Prolyl oligopeptidase family serine peptidase n=1 Tax=Bradyrhizobium aeschynomenes TaxID=2734909 RepID=A0ABX2CBI5_9BRAD|nr:acetylxylan esterase [Bradyrhizobium aeschynomenes]NPU64850.1 prolyl oligopeptidase family serine peptidase [Bradyrhizobium aeschynomenes]
MLRIIIALALCLAWPAAGSAQDTAAVRVTSDVSYEYLARWDVERLNKILTVDTPKFAGITVSYTPARNAVRLYRVTYASVVPERGNKPISATGLLAVPEISDTNLPMVSYQHGTVYGKQEVPSFPEQSPETQLMIAQFAGQGYLVIGADYFGMGTSSEPEGYMVKGSHQQATYDMLRASRAVLNDMHLTATRLSIAGWSQGGFVTMAYLEKLESAGVPVAAAATASAPVDVFVALNGFLSFPRSNDASWVNSLFILSAFAFENYYAVPGLARSVISDSSYEVARKAYMREPFNVAEVPTDLHKLLKPEYFDAQYFAASAYGRLVAQTQAYRWIIKTPVRNYYGETDEAISTGLGRLAMTYQQAIGAGNTKVEAVSTGPTSHRGTFATAVPQWKAWFDKP